MGFFVLLLILFGAFSSLEFMLSLSKYCIFLVTAGAYAPAATKKDVAAIWARVVVILSIYNHTVTGQLSSCKDLGKVILKSRV